MTANELAFFFQQYFDSEYPTWDVRVHQPTTKADYHHFVCDVMGMSGKYLVVNWRFRLGAPPHLRWKIVNCVTSEILNFINHLGFESQDLPKISVCTIR